MPSEQEILKTIAEVLPNPEVLADDAFVDVAGRIYTTDLLVEGSHFDLDYFSPADLGWKAAAVNLSDIAAMGGAPEYLLVSLGLSDNLSVTFVREFYQGMTTLAEKFETAIVGGDTVGMPQSSTTQVIVNVTATGRLPEGRPSGLRKNARAGDWVITTGHHGLAAVGLSALKQKLEGYETAKKQHLRPMPRLEAAKLLSEKYVRYALMDTSDGLADAAIKISAASHVTIQLEKNKLDFHPEVLRYTEFSSEDPLDKILYGGEDFELLATVPEVDDAVLKYFTVIGRVLDTVSGESNGAQIFWANEDGQEIQELLELKKTYQHFKDTVIT